MSTPSSDYRSFTRFAWYCFIALLTPFAIGLAISRASESPGDAGGSGQPPEVVLPAEIPASSFNSLPIAGHLVTPDEVAQRVIMNPRMSVTTGAPITGKGFAKPIDESVVGDTFADPID